MRKYVSIYAFAVLCFKTYLLDQLEQGVVHILFVVTFLNKDPAKELQVRVPKFCHFKTWVLIFHMSFLEMLVNCQKKWQFFMYTSLAEAKLVRARAQPPKLCILEASTMIPVSCFLEPLRSQIMFEKHVTVWWCQSVTLWSAIRFEKLNNLYGHAKSVCFAPVVFQTFLCSYSSFVINMFLYLLVSFFLFFLIVPV